jgi:hypothetical protein
LITVQRGLRTRSEIAFERSHVGQLLSNCSREAASFVLVCSTRSHHHSNIVKACSMLTPSPIGALVLTFSKMKTACSRSRTRQVAGRPYLCYHHLCVQKQHKLQLAPLISKSSKKKRLLAISDRRILSFLQRPPNALHCL